MSKLVSIYSKEELDLIGQRRKEIAFIEKEIERVMSDVNLRPSQKLKEVRNLAESRRECKREINQLSNGIYSNYA